ncbi:type II secretion system F family protein [Neobacillus vireti]|uniref:type II secretion system F family protein n=1 Tax=Neobacillus vireti TaxID=220686 RepID=UPI003000E635
MYQLAILFGFLLSVFLLFYFLLQLFLPKKQGLKDRLHHYLLKETASNSEEIQPEKKIEKETFSFFHSLKMYNSRLKKKVNHRKSNKKIELFLQSAASSWTPGEYIAFRWIFGGIFGGILYMLSGQLLLLLIGFIVGFLYPKLLLSAKQKKRIRQFNDGLQDMISTIISSMRAGYSFNQALRAVAEESSSPMKEEIELLLKELQYGINMEDALHRLYERVPSKDLDIMIQAVLIQRQVGGNLATVLAMIVDTIRERQKIQAQIKSLTAQGRMSGAVIGALPLVLGVLIYFIQPNYITILFTDKMGILLLSVALGMSLLGFVLIQKLTKIEV